MARVHYYSFLLNEEGQPIQDADVTVYLAGTNTPAVIYKDEFGGETASSAPQITTNSRGFFEFWIGDDGETYGYLKSQKFKIAWSKVGVATGYIDWINIFANIIEVDETDSSSTSKNKTVSNALAYGWEQHKIHDIRFDGYALPIHGIEAADEEDGSDADNWTSEQERFNKLINNKMAYQWDKHSDYTFDGTNAHPDTKHDTAHGLEGVDVTDTDTTKNKLVSNYVIKNLQDQISSNDSDILNVPTRDGTRGFTAPVSGSDPTASNELATKNYVDTTIGGNSHTEVIASASWSTSGTDYYYDVVHNLNVDYPIITTWNSTTKRVEKMSELESIDSNTVRLVAYTALNLYVRITE